MSTPFVDDVLDLLAPLGVPSARAMFGGYGIRLDGHMAAMVVEDELYLKADDAVKSTFEARGMMPFTYEAHGKLVAMSYFRVDGDVLERQDELLELASLSLAAAKRAPKKPRRAPRR